MKTVKMARTDNSNAPAPVLLTGAGGALGLYFCSAWAKNGLAGRRIVPLVRDGRQQKGTLAMTGHYLAPVEHVDLADHAQTEALIVRFRPSVIIHCAALANVDRCEDDLDKAFRDNVEGTRSIVDALQSNAPDCHLVHISTDQVYRDGGGCRGEIGPVNVYGWTKLWSEDIARQHKVTTVLRLNYVGRGTSARPGLVAWLVDSLRAEKPVTLFQDVLFNPCHGALVPQVVERMIMAQTTGTFNLGSRGGGLSKADFLLGVAQKLCLPTQTAKLGRLSDLSLKAPRSLDMRMDVSATETALGEQLPSLMETLEMLVAEWRKEEEHNAW